MKKYIFYIFMAAFGVSMLTSCEKDETKVYLNSEATAGDITTPATGEAYVLTDEDSADYITFSWVEPDYGFDAAISYTVQMDQEGNDFADAFDIISTTSPTDSIMIYTLNSKVIAQSYEARTATSFEVRIRSILSGENDSPYADTLYSDPITVTITPFEVEVSYPKLYLPGSYGSSGWAFGDGTYIIYSLNSDGKYAGYGYFATGDQFKFTTNADWTENYGDTSADGTLDSGGDNITMNVTGYYKINVNMNSLTYTMTETDWGIVGDFTGWADGADVPLNYDSSTGLLTATTDITAGSIKFRANGAWDINYGDTGADGTLDSGGDNITISSDGNYTISMDLSGPTYTYTIVKND